MSDKLREAIDRAEKENLATKGKEKVADKAKSKAKQHAGNAAKRGGKKALQGGKKLVKGAHRALGAKSKGYAKMAQLAARGVSALKNTKAVMALGKLAAAGGKFLAFLVTPFAGWVVSFLLILFIVAIANAGDDELEDVFEDSLGDTSVSEEEQEEAQNLQDEEFYQYYVEDDCPVEEYSPTINDDSYTSGGWMDEGSTAYNNAKWIFDIWVDAGLSGAAAAGIVGWTNSEGDFHMFGRAEGFYSSNEPEDASLAYGHVPVPSRSNYDVGGGGVYQFTPYTKYAELGSPDWEDPVKMHEYMFDLFRNELHSSAWMPGSGNDMTGENTSFEDFAKETDPERSVFMWNAYERANQSTVKRDQKKQDAMLAYEAFGGADYDFDPVRFEETFGESSEDYEHSSRAPSYDVCDPAHSSGGSWRGAGGQPSMTSGIWIPPQASSMVSGKDVIPDELREYAIDPESVGMKYADGDSWMNKWGDNGQCTHLTSNLAEYIWEKDGEPIHNMQGHGAQVVGNYATKYGADGESTTPTGGAIFSTTEGYSVNPDTGQKYGHTGIVSHVFDNGDFLVIETNMGGYSGKAIEIPYTYSYRYISKQKAKDGSFTFYDPSKVGFKLVPGIKSL